MLRSEHSIVRYDYHGQSIRADRLVRGRDRQYLSAAKIMLRIYRDGVGKLRQTLHGDVEQVLSHLAGCPPRRIAAFCKLLDDQATFKHDKRAAVELRQKVFSLAAPMHPIVERHEGIFENTVESARASIATELGMSWEEIETKLFSDVVELQTLESFRGPNEAAELLSIYNVAQIQAALYRAVSVRIDAFTDFKTVVRHVKLAGLMHGISKIDQPRPGYRFDLDGPQSSLRETTRYGVCFAALLPKLLTCSDWCLRATVIGPNRQRYQLRLSSDDGLISVLQPPDEFDSKLEHQLQDCWNESPVEGWVLERETELLHRGQTVLTPDFVMRQTLGGRQILIEVVGYWTPEYLEEKSRRLKLFVESNPESEWLLMFPKTAAASQRAIFQDLPVACIEFGKRADPKRWIEAARSIR